jgi:hypothetical protein
VEKTKKKKKMNNETTKRNTNVLCCFVGAMSLQRDAARVTRNGRVFCFVLFCFYFYGRVSGSHGVMFTDTPWGGRKYDNIISVMLGLSLSDIWLLDKGLVQFPIILHLFFRYKYSCHKTTHKCR